MVSAPEATRATSDEQPRERPLGRPGPGWVPCAIVLAATALTVHWYGVSVRDIAAFSGYSALAVTLPGTLLWRLMMRRAGHIGVDAAAGTAVGYAVEIPAYVLARALDVPLAVLAWPVVTIVLFAAVPSLRRHWRGSGERMPAGISWSVAALMLYALVNSALSAFRVEAVSGSLASAPYVDDMFQLALVSELRHHFPATMPYLTGTPLQYHWYVHAHGAAASWVTGIEPQVLLLRLLPLPMLYMVVLLFVGLARTLTRRWWPGLLAYGLSSVAAATSPYAWTRSPFPPGSVLSVAWYSPTQTFAAALFAALVLVVVELLRGTAAPGPGPWIAAALLAGAVAGAKATFLPILACGLALAVLVGLIARRRPGRAAGMLGIVAGWLVFAQLGLYGGGDQGMEVAPLSAVKGSAPGQAVLGTPTAANPWPTLLVLGLLAVVTWLPAFTGGVGLLRRGTRTDPGYATLVGVGIAGVAALLLLGHPGQSEQYFMISGSPYLFLAAACGVAMLVPGLERRRTVLLAVAAAAAGVAAVYAVRLTVGAHRPATGLWNVVRPYVVLFAAVAVLAAVVLFAARTLRLHRRAGLAGVVVLLLATTLPVALVGPRSLGAVAKTGRLKDVRAFINYAPPGGIQAARWLRDHSDPDDLVATNDHCLGTITTACDSRNFWLAGYAERRVLVEGWSYTDRANDELPLFGLGVGRAPFWDPALLATNDAAFTSPDATDVATLARTYHVRWLVAVAPTASPALAGFATLRYASGRVSVYEITG
ncbi:MAG TPA: hypothetical protein VKB69_09475 [Micromonosporaceae bacterium]|nr:hypothetical protein [Micromonosporaceae bacterium]